MAPACRRTDPRRQVDACCAAGDVPDAQRYGGGGCARRDHERRHGAHRCRRRVRGDADRRCVRLTEATLGIGEHLPSDRALVGMLGVVGNLYGRILPVVPSVVVVGRLTCMVAQVRRIKCVCC